MNSVNLYVGDCLATLKTLPDNSIDSIVTDPPYGLSFMGKKWDYDVPSVAIWQECLRVLKPGGHLLSFGGTRTYHRLVVNIEDAGFEIRDCIQWLYGSGFPKSTDVSKRIDKEAGAEREVIGSYDRRSQQDGAQRKSNGDTGESHCSGRDSQVNLTAPATDSAKQWQGWGTALKPANEPICVARKPLEKGLTVAENVQKWGCGAINIDASRIALNGESITFKHSEKTSRSSGIQGNSSAARVGQVFENTQGRWPANIILDEEVATLMPVENKQSVSRFFYVAKASKRERGEGNVHPTVKPTKLMEYLIKLVTPAGGVILDPFMGSGSTGVAAKKLNFRFVGCELDSEYLAIASERIETA
jgi:DNA modification methylase